MINLDEENILEDEEEEADSYIFQHFIVGSIQDSLSILKSAESYFSVDEEESPSIKINNKYWEQLKKDDLMRNSSTKDTSNLNL